MFAAMAALLAALPIARGQDWRPAPGPMLTRWAAEVDPAAPWPEYPRPALVRERWLNLNGLWGLAITRADETLPGEPPATRDTPGEEGEAPAHAGQSETLALDGSLGPPGPGPGAEWDRQILVPFAVESSLSGVGELVGPGRVAHYRRTFRVPAGWLGDDGRVWLHFGAVDWACRVEVNGRVVGSHRGGFDPFSFDITDALGGADAAGGTDHTLIVSASDPTNLGGQPRGKQWNKPHGIWYTSVTGIWQTVWLEPVPRGGVDSLKIQSDRRSGAVRITVGAGPTSRPRIFEAEASFGGRRVAASRSSGPVIDLGVPDPRPWSPAGPNLYDVKIRVYDGGRLIDEAASYFAFRDVAVARDAAGINRILLNGDPVFMFGPLDQGYWPDGLYTPPTDAAMRFDVEAVKRMGGTMLRKHVKVEPQRFYAWCDRLGVLVWQDMPSPFFEVATENGRGGWDEDFPALTDAWKAHFEAELAGMVRSLSHHPSIVMWVPFNEGWGQNDLGWARGVVDRVAAADPSRLVNAASGWTDTGNGHVLDIHAYPGPSTPAAEPARAAVLGEFGGLGLPIEGHTWAGRDNWGYVSYDSPGALTDAYVRLLGQVPPLIADGLCAAVYTQTTDVEIECNGWLTYDREVWKIDPDRAAAAAAPLYQPPPRYGVILPRAGHQGPGGRWRYRMDPPGTGWEQPGFDDSAWAVGPGGFGAAGTPGAVIGTPWATGEIWLRRRVDLPPCTSPLFSLHHDEDAEVYVNGVLALTTAGYTVGYRVFEPSADAGAILRAGGPVTIAVRCRQTAGGQYIDLGIVEARP